MSNKKAAPPTWAAIMNREPNTLSERVLLAVANKAHSLGYGFAEVGRECGLRGPTVQMYAQGKHKGGPSAHVIDALADWSGYDAR